MEQTVSIIVPVYNAAKTLARCVDSLTGQTYENLEILLVNRILLLLIAYLLQLHLLSLILQ